jgi:membrane fusion protein (multidrug efflux system)
LTAAQATVRGQIAQARANRYKLEHAIEDVDNQVANLHAAVAKLESQKATLTLAQANLKRGEELAPSGGISKEDLDQRRQTVKVDEAAVDQALQNVYSIRVGLGLPAEPPGGHDLTEVPKDLDQTFSSVRQALGELLQSAAQFGYFPASWTASPKEAIEAFYKQDPEGNLNRIYERIIPKAPAI